MARQQILRDIHDEGLDPKKKHKLHKHKLAGQQTSVSDVVVPVVSDEPINEEISIDAAVETARAEISETEIVIESAEISENKPEKVKQPKPPKKVKK